MNAHADLDSHPVEELIAASEELDGRVEGLFDQLGQITATAADPERGIEVTVNLEGRPIDLTLTPRALDHGADRLAEEIFRLAQQAAGTALTEGIALLAPVAGRRLTAELEELLDFASHPPSPTAEPPGDNAAANDDFSTIESWALPR